MKIQTTRTVDDIMDEDWRSRFLPEVAEEVELPPEGFEPELDSTGDGLPDPFETPIVTNDEAFDTVEDEETVAKLLEEESFRLGTESQLAVVLDNQQRLMMALDQMSSGFSSQLVILARRIDNFERVLDQSIGQPTMTNLMFDAPEVFDKVVTREEEPSDNEGTIEPAVEPRTPRADFEIPDEVEHLLNYSADFPVAAEVQAAFYMWKQKLSTFQEFVKVAGGPVAAKKARTHLE